jgi:hypothetical protein
VLVDVECEVTDMNMSEMLYNEINENYTMKTANFGPLGKKQQLRSKMGSDMDLDVTNPMTACEIMDDDCEIVYPSTDEDAEEE